MDHGRDEKMTLVDYWVQLWGREEGEGRRGKGGGGRGCRPLLKWVNAKLGI